MKNANDLWIGSVPKEWLSFRIKDVTQLSPGFSGNAPQLNDLCTVVPMESISEKGKIDTSTIEEYDLISGGLPNFEAGDVIFAKITPCMENGKGAYVESLPTRYAFGSTEFHVLRPGFNVDSKFLYYYTYNSVFREYAAVNMTEAAGQKRISSRFLNYTRIFLPSIPDQRRIAAYLDKTCAAIDTAIEKKQKQLEILDELHKAKLHVTFARDEWPVERIKDVAKKIGSGVTPEGGAAGYLDDGIPLLRSQNVHFDGLRLDDVAFISKETHTEMASSQLKPRDVLLNITGASIGRCTFVPEDFGEGNVNQHVCIIRGNYHKIDYRYLTAFLSSPIGQGQILSSFTGASRQGLSHKELGLIRIPLPLLEVQHEIVVALEEQKSRQNQVRINIESQIETLIAYRKSLIHECVTGKRRITEEHLKEIETHV